MSQDESKDGVSITRDLGKGHSEERPIRVEFGDKTSLSGFCPGKRVNYNIRRRDDRCNLGIILLEKIFSLTTDGS